MSANYVQKLVNLVPSVSIFTASFFTFLLAISITSLLKRRKFMQKCEKIPGPPAQIPFFGSITDVLLNPEDLIGFVQQLHKQYRGNGQLIRVWIGAAPVFITAFAETAEFVLSSSQHITKSAEYDYLVPWLGTGLLISTGKKWHERRKMLTPSFHFKILEDFVHIFNEQSCVLVQELDKTVGNIVDIFPFITMCTLDIICETAMGRHVNAQTNLNSEYVKAVYKMGRIIQHRQFRPWLQPDWMLHLQPDGFEQRRCLKILHGFTDQVIRERKAEYKKHKAEEEQKMASSNMGDDLLPKKRRLAFLDLLIEASDDGKYLSDFDIREEVDTFMFEGHDTTAAAITWTILMIGHHPEVQDKISEELARVFEDSDRPITSSDLAELKYLECCIKEGLRMFPSVPFLARRLAEDVSIGGYDLPGGSSIILATYWLHRDPRYFPDPERFLPERFFPENSRGRHPYAYVPFSAGPRNCIGQKFAMMEEKLVLASVLRRFRVESFDRLEDMDILAEVILRPGNEVKIRLTRKS